MFVLNKLIVRVAFAAALVAGAAFMALPANAVTINWTLSGVTFDDGGTASGTFSTDSTNGNLLTYNITTTLGSTLGGAVYDSTTSFIFCNNCDTANSFLTIINGYSRYIELAFVNPLTSLGVDSLVPGNLSNNLLGSWECNNCSLFRNVVSGEAFSGVTPLPSTWLMLLSGFVGLGFLAYRGTNKNVAAIAA